MDFLDYLLAVNPPNDIPAKTYTCDVGQKTQPKIQTKIN